MDRIREIYEKVIEESAYMESATQAVEQAIKELLENNKEYSSVLEYEQYRDIIFQVAATAEEESFIIGFQYAVTLITGKLIHV